MDQQTQRELAQFIEDTGENVKDIKRRLVDIEQAGARHLFPNTNGAHMSAGEIFTRSAAYLAAIASPAVRVIEAVDVKRFAIGGRKAAIVSSFGSDGEPILYQAQRAPVAYAPQAVGAVRDLLNVVPTSSGAIEYPKETTDSSTDWIAAPQYSSPSYENVAKKELKVAFTLETESMKTIAGWIPASRQILADSRMLAGYVNSRLTWGVKKEEERQLCVGSGASGEMTGLVTAATAFSGGTTGDTILDVLLRAIGKMRADGYYQPDGIVLHPNVVTELLLLKTTTGEFLLPDANALAAKLGVNVAQSVSMTDGDYVVVSSAGSTLFDREQATVRVAEQHEDYFVKNMVAILGEERLALVVYDTRSLLTGSL